MKQIKRVLERIVESILTVSGAITSIAILLIVVFLFKEGLGLFNSPSVENGYSLYVNSKNTGDDLSVKNIKHIFDSEVTLRNWGKLLCKIPIS